MSKFQTICDRIFLPFILFLCKIYLPQAKWNLKSSITNFAYKLFHKMLNNLMLQVTKKKKENNKIFWRYKLVRTILSKKLFLSRLVKTYAKSDNKVFWSCSVLVNFLTFDNFFCPKFHWTTFTQKTYFLWKWARRGSPLNCVSSN